MGTASWHGKATVATFAVRLLLTPARAAAADGTCDGWLGAEETGRVTDAAMPELSGIAASRANPGVYWVHNDGGNTPTVFAIDASGAVLAAFDVPEAENDDWEDIAVGPCDPDEPYCSCVYVADTGDELLDRVDYAVYRFPEPIVGEATEIVAVESFPFVYPDGPHDAEGLAVDPLTGTVFVFTKEATTGVYRFPEAPLDGDDGDVELDTVARLSLDTEGAADPLVTAADLSASGARLVLRTDKDVLLYEAPAGGNLYDALDAAPLTLPAPEEANGEAVTFSDDGTTLVFVGEGAASPVWEVRCTAFAEGGLDPLATCAPETRRCGCAASPTPVGALAVPILAFLGARRRALKTVAERRGRK